MAYKIEVTDKAKSDIDEIANYLVQTTADFEVARKFISGLYDRIEILGDFPESGSNPRNHILLSQGYKFLVYGQYLIFYRVEKELVFISSIFHSKKDYLKNFRF